MRTGAKLCICVQLIDVRKLFTELLIFHYNSDQWLVKKIYNVINGVIPAFIRSHCKSLVKIEVPIFAFIGTILTESHDKLFDFQWF